MYKEKMTNLMMAIDKNNHVGTSNRDMMFNLVKQGFDSFIGYVNAVYEMETSISLARFRCDDVRDYQDAVTRLDSSRRVAHDGAITSVNIINRMCDMVGVEHVYDGTQERNEIGDFCGHFVNEYFEGRALGRVISAQERDEVFEEEIGFER